MTTKQIAILKTPQRVRHCMDANANGSGILSAAAMLTEWAARNGYLVTPPEKLRFLRLEERQLVRQKGEVVEIDVIAIDMMVTSAGSWAPLVEDGGIDTTGARMIDA